MSLSKVKTTGKERLVNLSKKILECIRAYPMQRYTLKNGDILTRLCAT